MFDESICDVGDVVSSMRFACQVDVVVLQVESVDELPVGADEFICEVNFVDDVQYALSVTNPDLYWLARARSL